MTVTLFRILFATQVIVNSVIFTANAGGVFQITLDQFTNDQGVDQTGQCCSGTPADQSSSCSSPCRTAFRVCLKHYLANVDPDPPCTYGMIETPVIGENTFSPKASQFFRNTAIEFNFTFRWMGSFSLIIDVFHENGNTSLGTENIDSSKVLISRLIKSGNVLPSSDGAWTTPVPYKHRDTELRYSYRVVCERHLYGPGCTTYCEGRDDVFGHYRCNENGEKVCLAGWSGDSKEAYCTRAICQNGCSATQGTCVEPNQCKCHYGWEGSDCTQCVLMPGCVHGTCTEPHQCRCKPGWGGVYCNQDLNYCTNHQPCQNEGLCSNTGQGSYTCRCKPGFKGRDCEFEEYECEPNPCKNGAKCVDLINDYKCTCPAGFFGRDCDQTHVVCSDSPCQHGGVCIDGPEHYQCRCQPEWTGVNCETPTNHCSENPCQNGICESTGDGFVCVCHRGYIGKFCDTSISLCADQSCLNGGKCREPTFISNKCGCLQCECAPRFTGERCDMEIPETPKTQIILVNEAEKSLSTTHWIAICFGSGILVLLLVISAGCLVYHRKKVSLARLQQKLKQQGANQRPSGDMDLSVVADHSDNSVEDEDHLQKMRNAEPYTSTSNFSSQRCSRENDPMWESYKGTRSKSSPAKRSSSDRNVRPYSIQYARHSIVKEIPDNVSEIKMTRQQSVPLQPTVKGGTVYCPEAGGYYDHAHRHSRHSLSRLPTYEEVCEENDALLRQQGYKCSDSAVVL